jgi:hypothetical protein
VGLFGALSFKFEARQTAINICSELLHLTQQVQKKKSPNGHFNMHGTLVPDWIGSKALSGQITSFFSRAEKPSEDNNTAFTVSLMNPSITQYQFSLLLISWNEFS